MKISFSSVCYNYVPRYTFVILWLALNGILFWDTFCEYKYGPRYYYIHEMLGVGLCVSRAAATVLNLNLGALLLPMCKSLMAALRGILPMMSKNSLTSLIDRCKGFHILCAYLVIMATVVHFVGHMFNVKNFSAHYNTAILALNAADKPQQDPLYIVLTSWPCISGLIMVLVLVLIVTSASAAVRSSSYDLFWFTHRLYFLLYGLTVVHGFRPYAEVGYAEPSPLDPDSPDWVCDEMPQFHRIPVRSWMWVGLPLFIFACDTIYSYCRRHLLETEVINATKYPGNILQLHLVRKNFHIRPGQYVLIRCPSAASFQLHPYTVSRVPTPDDPEFSVHIKSSGDWSENVSAYFERNHYIYTEGHNLLPLQHKRPRKTNAPHCRLYLEGPFGSPMEDVLRYRVSICVAGGIGITPFAAILNHILQNVTVAKLERLYLIWINRDAATIACFSDLLYSLHTKLWQNNNPDLLEIHLHVTGKSETPPSGIPKPEVREFLQRRTTRGRPCWSLVLNRIATTYPRYHIGVFSCGPKSLNKTLQENTLRKYNSSTVFHYYHESF